MRGLWASRSHVRLLLVLLTLRASLATTAYISVSGSCTPKAPPGAACMTFKDALNDTTVIKMVFIEDVHLQQQDWMHLR